MEYHLDIGVVSDCPMCWSNGSDNTNAVCEWVRYPKSDIGVDSDCPMCWSNGNDYANGVYECVRYPKSGGPCKVVGGPLLQDGYSERLMLLTSWRYTALAKYSVLSSSR